MNLKGIMEARICFVSSEMLKKLAKALPDGEARKSEKLAGEERLESQGSFKDTSTESRASSSITKVWSLSASLE